MGGGLRNKQWLRVAVILSVILLVLYLIVSLRSSAQDSEMKLAAAELNYKNLLDNFNKLNDELKHTVQRAAATRHDLEKAEKAKELEVNKKDEQIKRCLTEMKEMKATVQSMESDRDRYKSDKSRLEQDKLEQGAEAEKLRQEMENVRLISVQNSKENQKCKSDLETANVQLLSAQTGSLGVNQRLTECQGQLTIAERSYETCQTKVTSLEAENYNKQSEIQQLQLETNTLKQQQQQQQQQRQPQSLGGNNNPPARQQQNFQDIDILNDQKQKTLAGLKEKLLNGQVLTAQEQQVLQLLTKDDPLKQQLPPGNKLSLPLPDNKEGNPVPVYEEQIQDLVNEEGGEKDKKAVNLDGKEDGDFEGGADGGDEDEQDPHGQEYEQLKRDANNDFNDDGRDEDFNDHVDERDEGFNQEPDNDGNPLPDPVGQVPVVDLPNGDSDIMDDPDGHEAFKRDQEHLKNEWQDRRLRNFVDNAIKNKDELPRQRRDI